MVEALLGGGSLDPEVLDRVVEAAEGNPLYAEQLLRMLVDEGVLERRERHVARDRRRSRSCTSRRRSRRSSPPGSTRSTAASAR